MLCYQKHRQNELLKNVVTQEDHQANSLSHYWELYFPKFDYELTCDDNSLIMFPGWVEHGVKKVSIKDSDYYEGNGRYCISSFINNVGR